MSAQLGSVGDRKIMRGAAVLFALGLVATAVFPAADALISTVIVVALALLLAGWLIQQVAGEFRLTRECGRPLRRPAEPVEGERR